MKDRALKALLEAENLLEAVEARQSVAPRGGGSYARAVVLTARLVLEGLRSKLAAGHAPATILREAEGIARTLAQTRLDGEKPAPVGGEEALDGARAAGRILA